jgi:hypothetical protein
MSDRSDDAAAAGTDGDGRPDTKVGRLIGTYDLGPEFGDRLEALWTADGEERESLRTLADRFNRRLLESRVDDAGLSMLDGEVTNLYRLLTSDEVSSGMRTEARRRLEQGGIDVDRLEREFVSYQAIRTYLKEYRGASYDGESERTRVQNETETIQRLQSRIRSVAETSLTGLRRTGRLSLGEHRLFVEVNVFCEDCNTQYGLVELMERGGCECE